MAPIDTPLPFGIMSSEEVLRRVAARYDLRIGAIGSNGFAPTQTLHSYYLGGGLLDYVKASGFELEVRDDGVTTLRMSNPDYPADPGYAHNCYWNFRTHNRHKDQQPDPLTLNLMLKVGVSELARGIICRPFVCGSFLTAGDQVPHTILSRALVKWSTEKGDDLNPVLRVASGLGKAVLAFSEFGLGSLRSVRGLFGEFVGERPLVGRLASSNLNPFSPSPYGAHDTVWFVPEPHQADLMDQWRRQLAEFRNSLV